MTRIALCLALMQRPHDCDDSSTQASKPRARHGRDLPLQRIMLRGSPEKGISECDSLNASRIWGDGEAPGRGFARYLPDGGLARFRFMFSLMYSHALCADDKRRKALLGGTHVWRSAIGDVLKDRLCAAPECSVGYSSTNDSSSRRIMRRH
jgi:hypothetical protein